MPNITNLHRIALMDMEAIAIINNVPPLVRSFSDEELAPRIAFLKAIADEWRAQKWDQERYQESDADRELFLFDRELARAMNRGL